MAKDKNKKPFNVLSKKGFATLALAGVMAVSPFMLVGCGEAGPAGKDGATGATGATGKSAYELAVDAGFTGTLEEWLESLKGSAGNSVVSVIKTATNGLVDTYTITFSDGTTTTFDVTNGADGGIGPQGPEGTQGVSGVSSYTHIKYANVLPDENSDILTSGTGDYIGIYTGTSEQAPTNFNDYTWHKIKGEDGAPGTSKYVWIKYSDTMPDSNEDIKDSVGDYIGVYSGDSATAPTDYAAYTWSKIKGRDGGSTATTQSAWANKSAVFVGDSITAGSGTTAGNRYWELLEDYLQLGNVTDMGIGGSCISVTSDYGTQYNPLSTRYNSIPEADLIQIFMGTNDYGHDTPLGTIADTTDISFYGALNVIIPALQTKYPESRIVFVTPLHRYGANGLTYDYTENGAGNTLKDYVDAIKEVCERYSVPVIDLFTISGINPAIADVKTAYMPDGIHPNDAGHELIANLMANHLELFATDRENVETAPEQGGDTSGDEGNNNEGSEGGSGSESGGEENENPSESIWKEIGFDMGNLFSNASDTQQSRISIKQNVYLTTGQQLALLNSTNHKYFLYKQTSETRTVVSAGEATAIMTEWRTTPYYVTTDGWYGVVVATNDNSNFDSSTISTQTLEDYITIETENVVNGDISTFNFVLGNKYVNEGVNIKHRVTINKNIFLVAGTTISLVTPANYKFAIYTQSDETLVSTPQGSGLLSGGFITTTFTVESNGYYGIVLAKIDDAEFDFTSESDSAATYILIVNE